VHDRRKSQRDSVKKVTIKGNKVSKIIFYKSIALPIFTLILSIFFFIYVGITYYFKAEDLNQRLKKIQDAITTTIQKQKRLKEQNKKIVQELSQSNSMMVDTKEVSKIIDKMIYILKLKHLIDDAKIVSIQNDTTYQNVANITLEVQYDPRYLTLNIIKDILKLILNELLYIKDINIQNDQINISVYKKVSS